MSRYVARGALVLTKPDRKACPVAGCRLSPGQLRVLAIAYDYGEYLPLFPRNGHDSKIFEALERKGLLHRSERNKQWYLTNAGRRRVRAALGKQR